MLETIMIIFVPTLIFLLVLLKLPEKKVSKLLITSIAIIYLFVQGGVAYALFPEVSKNWEAHKTRRAKIKIQEADRKSQEAYYCSILEINVGASKEEIREAYDRLYIKYTLDSIRHEQREMAGSSASSEERKANKALEDIEEAYTELMKKFD